MEKEIITYKLAKTAKENGMPINFKNWIYTRYKGTEDEALYVSTVEPNIKDSEVSDIRREVDATYHQLIDWVFQEVKWHKGKTKIELVNWLEFWYNLLKDCPLKHELRGRLLEWLEKNHCYIELSYDYFTYDVSIHYKMDNVITLESTLGDETPYCIISKDNAYILAIEECFKLLKNDYGKD